MDNRQPHLHRTNISVPARKRKIVDLGDTSRMMRHVGAAQYKIGWRHFTESNIERTIRNLLEIYLLSYPTLLTIDAWIGGLIEKLLDLTHL